MKYLPFLKWWLAFTLVCVGALFAYHIGFFHALWQKDSSYLSFATLILFLFMSLKCGFNTLLLSHKIDNHDLKKEDLDTFERHEELGWFVSELCLTLGMIGTIIGFVFMLAGFEDIDMSKPQTIQALLSDLGRSMATALYTTLVGLICGSLLKVQYFNLSLTLQEHGGHSDDNTIVSSTSPLSNDSRVVEELVPLTAEQEAAFESVAKEVLGLNEAKNEN